MTARSILVDGYNVIGADPTLSGLQAQSLEAAREALIKSVAGSPRFLGDRVTIVFDGARSPLYASNQRFGHVTAVFSTAGASADDVIKAQAKASPNPASVVVVTNDSDIRDYCRLLGCTVTGSENLLEQVALPRKLRRPRTAGPADDYSPATLSTSKKGNPKRRPKASRKPADYRF